MLSRGNPEHQYVLDVSSLDGMDARQRGSTRSPGMSHVRPGAVPPPSCRVVVERVLPEIDGGRFPVKRTVGESLSVTAWIHADGHDALAAVLRYRPVSTRGRRAGWVEQPL